MIPYALSNVRTNCKQRVMVAYSRAMLPLIPGESCHPKNGGLAASSDAGFPVVVWAFSRAPDASQKIIHAGVKQIEKYKQATGKNGHVIYYEP